LGCRNGLYFAGKYKFVHSRVRTHSESIAFFGGGAREKVVVRARYQKVIAALTRKSYQDFGFGIAKGMLIHQIPERIQDYVRFSHAYDNFDDKLLLADNGAALSMELHNIWCTALALHSHCIVTTNTTGRLCTWWLSWLDYAGSSVPESRLQLYGVANQC
jgi:hypothetical protein